MHPAAALACPDGLWGEWVQLEPPAEGSPVLHPPLGTAASCSGAVAAAAAAAAGPRLLPCRHGRPLAAAAGAANKPAARRGRPALRAGLAVLAGWVGTTLLLGAWLARGVPVLAGWRLLTRQEGEGLGEDGFDPERLVRELEDHVRRHGPADGGWGTAKLLLHDIVTFC